MYDSTTQRNKALWIGTVALLTLGSVVFYAMLRKSENTSKPPKDQNARELDVDRSIVPPKLESNNEEQRESTEEAKQGKLGTTLDDAPPSKDDVPQTKATLRLDQEMTETADISSEPVKLTPTSIEQDQIDADTLIAAAIATATYAKDNNAIMDDETVNQITVDGGNDLDKSPLLTAAPSPSSSSDTSSSQLKQELANLTTSTSTSGNFVKNNNNICSNGTGVNGYWQTPATNATFQHSMGWPELFPLQQQDGDQTKSASPETVMTKKAPTTTAATMEGKKKGTKKRMSRPEQIDQQRQNHVPSMKSRCNWWPNCTNNNCKYHHPYQPCRYGDLCFYNERCMFLHTWDYEEPVRQTKQQKQQLQQNDYQYYQQLQQYQYQQYQPTENRNLKD